MTGREDPDTIGGVSQAALVPDATSPDPRDDVLHDALTAVDEAAGGAAVELRVLDDLAEMAQAVALFDTIWGRSTNPPFPLELMRALAKAGNYVGGAFAGDRLVGACVGFFHAPLDDALHSHIAGVAPGMTGRSIGFALKLHQRAWALARGVGHVAWTFDPLVSRNAHVNLAKLGARPAEYLINFYGPMVDSINGGDDSDRLLVRWELRDPAVVRSCSGGGVATDQTAPDDAVVAVGTGEDGSPVPGRLDGEVSLVAVPHDIRGLRASDPETARAWRLHVREAMTTLLGDGARITGFGKDGGYILRRDR